MNIVKRHVIEKLGTKYMTSGISEFKFLCPHCGQHLEAEADMIGTEIECPVCGNGLKVPAVQTKPQKYRSRFKKCWIFAGAGLVAVWVLISGVCMPLPGNREKSPDVQANSQELSSSIGRLSSDNNENRMQDKAEAVNPNDNAVVAATVRCLLNFIRRPNDRRAQALLNSLESCPVGFQEAVIKYLDSTKKTVNDFMPETNESFEEEVERELYARNYIRRGSPIDIDPRLAGLKSLAVVEVAGKVKRRRESRIESAKLRLKAEIENAVKHLVDVAEKYGIDAIELEDALLD